MTDPQLLTSTRENAFEGLLNVAALSDEIIETRRALRRHFLAILGIIDTLMYG